jgi:hypothetical protein
MTADIDFAINGKATTTGISAIPTKHILMTTDCFKMLFIFNLGAYIIDPSIDDNQNNNL